MQEDSRSLASSYAFALLELAPFNVTEGGLEYAVQVGTGLVAVQPVHFTGAFRSLQRHRGRPRICRAGDYPLGAFLASSLARIRLQD